MKTCYYQSLALHRWLPGFKHLRAASKLGHRLGREHDLVMLEARVPATGAASKWLRRIGKKRQHLHRRALREGIKLCRHLPQPVRLAGRAA